MLIKATTESPDARMKGLKINTRTVLSRDQRFLMSTQEKQVTRIRSKAVSCSTGANDDLTNVMPESDYTIQTKFAPSSFGAWKKALVNRQNRSNVVSPKPYRIDTAPRVNVSLHAPKVERLNMTED